MDDLLDIIDQIFDIQQDLYQKELIELLTGYIDRAKQEYLTTLQQQTADNKCEDILSADEYTAADDASVCQYIQEITAKYQLNPDAVQCVFEYCTNYFRSEKRNETSLGFYLALGFVLILKYRISLPDNCAELVRFAVPVSLGAKE